MKLKDIHPNPDNPRTISREKLELLKESLKRNPRFMELKPLKLDEKNTILGGNQRYVGLLELGYEDIPDEWVKFARDFTPEELREFIILDNSTFGEWAYPQLLQDYTIDELQGYGLDLPDFILSAEGLSDDFSLPAGDRKPFQQMTFIFSDKQAEYITKMLKEARSDPSLDDVDNHGNENKNGNALHFIVKQWEELRT
jgi:hypothetical protein